MISVAYFTDPACPWSWGAEPVIRKLMHQFRGSLRWTFVMGGLARAVEGFGEGPAVDRAKARLVERWLRVAEETGMPIDPLLWVDSPIDTTYPACMAVKAAEEQVDDSGYRYLRRLREGLLCERRKLDRAEALVEEGRAAGLDLERLRIDLRSHAITEALGRDLERTAEIAARALGPEAAEQVTGRFSSGVGGAPLPTLVFASEDGEESAVFGLQPYATVRAAAERVGARAENEQPPSVEALIERFGRVTTKEVEIVCELPGPRASAELFRLAEQWRVRPLWRMTGYVWEKA